MYTYNGVTRTVTTTADTSLGALRDLINNDAGNPGLSASILEYEVDADHKYHLVLSGDNTGSDYTITVEAATTLSGFAPGSFEETMAAQDSQIRVDGYPSADWIERSSNSISDVIEGVTLNLNGTGTASVTLARDTGQLGQDLQNLVNIYNGIVLVVDEYTGYDDVTGAGGVLQGDGDIAGMVGWIRSIITSTVPGFVDGMDTYTLAAHLGIEIDSYGMLSLDESTMIGAATLADALAEDYQAVLNLIGTSGTGGSTSSYIQFTSADESTTPGVYEVEVDFDGGGTITAARIRTEGETEWNDATVNDNVVTGMSGKPEQFMQLVVTWDGSSTTQSAEVRVRRGLAGALYDRLEDILDAEDGAMTVKKTANQDAVDELTIAIGHRKSTGGQGDAAAGQVRPAGGDAGQAGVLHIGLRRPVHAVGRDEQRQEQVRAPRRSKTRRGPLSACWLKGMTPWTGFPLTRTTRYPPSRAGGWLCCCTRARSSSSSRPLPKWRRRTGPRKANTSTGPWP